MRKQLISLSKKVSDELERDKSNSQVLVQLLTAEGIMVDKLTAILRSLRGLESESGSDLEASFIIIEEGDDGKRKVISCASELPDCIELIRG